MLSAVENQTSRSKCLWKSFRHKLQTASQLLPCDWLGLAEAWWVLLGFYLVLRLVKFERLQKFSLRTNNKTMDQADALTFAWGRQRLVSMAARLHLLSMTCLPRALTMRWMLGRKGIITQLCIGINRSPTGMLAHSWVELAGQAVGEPEDITERFMVLGPV
jgi:hypothetical protein